MYAPFVAEILEARLALLTCHGNLLFEFHNLWHHG